MPKRNCLKLACSITTLMLLQGCAGAVSEGTTYTCPPLFNYSVDFEKTVSREMDLAGNASWPRMVKDYGHMRQMCRSLTKGN